MAVLMIGQLILGFLAGLMIAPTATSYRVVVDAVSEDCFFDRVDEVGRHIGIIFEVIDGGFLDIDLIITGPDGEILHSIERETSGKFAIAASKVGVYTYCFSNKMSTITPKEIMFSIDVSEKDKAISKPGDYTAKEIEEIQPEKLEVMIKELKTVILGIKHDQEYMEVRDRIHIRINESTNRRVVMWSVFESLTVTFVTVSQIYYIKRFFEVCRVV